MHTVPRIAVLAFMLFSYSLVGAQVQIDDDVALVKYENSPLLPDGAAFLDTLQNLNLLSMSDPEMAAAWIQQEMGLPETKSHEFLGTMLLTFDAISAEIQSTYFQLGCSGGSAKVFGDDVFKVFEQMDDANESVAAEHLQDLIGSIDKDVAGRLEQWLEVRKTTITYVKFDHKKSYGRHGDDADGRLTKICSSLAASHEERNR